ncbi:hypothetical protein SAMN04487906_2400 [Zhouia amylolytica]|uniref:F5/8 type C domain-containing protein n=2 Tax=Zhouia amylolytica TaxID=376730 RepID=A0A1I6UDL2_9FLAO|nr:hypothetical protein SAMN04487906_2400 [Zhouia amylolytica]
MNMNYMRLYCVFFMMLLFTKISVAQETIYPGANEGTPSKAQYFSWINNTNEGATEEQTMINFDFFEWLKDTYGMQLDIYAFDAGAIDGKRFYGSINSERFDGQFPHGFDPIYERAKRIGFRLGVWGGPDGFGDTPEEEKRRIQQMVSLCRDYDFALFKFDAVCGPLRPEKEDAFIEMMEQCRTYSPDLILLNHRLGLNKAKPYATTFLWGGNETYIDVFMTNNTTAPHHRAGALARGLVPGLKRLTEDHGVCISSCLDYWDDDLILQAFNRSLILAPEIYGNPWLLSDEEFPKLARIYNIHRKYKDILTKGMALPEDVYGPDAVSRGDQNTRIITVKNLSWSDKTYTIRLDQEIGINGSDGIKLIQVHPNEQYLGSYTFGDEVKVSVPPFRSALFIATTRSYETPLIKGAPYQIIKDVPGETVILDVLGAPDSKRVISLQNPELFKSGIVEGKSAAKLLEGKGVKVRFKGEGLKLPTHRKLNEFEEIPIPHDSDALYEATVFAADNNALEIRSLHRSGSTEIPQVQKARDAFFNQKVFVERGIWDKNLFDGSMETGFWPSRKYNIDQKIKGGAFRLNLGELTAIDQLIIKVPDDFSLQPLLTGEANYVEVSKDLNEWKQLSYIAGKTMSIHINDTIQYLRFKEQPQRITEIEGLYQDKPLNRRNWRASNLFAYSNQMNPVKAWKSSFVLEELAGNSYLSIALNGKHGIEGAYVAAKIDGKLVGAPDRAVSYPSNTWEYVNAKADSNYTYYIPLDDSCIGKDIEVYVMAYDKEHLEIRPEVWISSPNQGKEKIRIEFERK